MFNSVFKATLKNKLVLSALVTVTSIATPTSIVQAGPIGTQLSPELRLLVSRQKAKSNQNLTAEDYIKLEDKRDAAFEDSNGECGNVNIGNINSGNRIGQRPTTVNVVVTENIVNLGDDDC